MASLEENRHYWNSVYDWSLAAGEEWSRRWGGSGMQWHWSVYPRIAEALPCGRLVEIGPGFGRWTYYLKDHCQSLLGVDLAARCVHTCKLRFADDPNLKFVVNDGTSLPVKDASVDFVFSFESLVHAEAEVMAAYLSEVARVLKDGKTAFLHHSNLGEYPSHFLTASLLPQGARAALNRWGLVDIDQWRAPSMSAPIFRRLAREAGLAVVGQELVNWGARRLIDCFSIVRKGPQIAEPVIVRNPRFMHEVLRVGRLAEIYGDDSDPWSAEETLEVPGQ